MKRVIPAATVALLLAVPPFADVRAEGTQGTKRGVQAHPIRSQAPETSGSGKARLAPAQPSSFFPHIGPYPAGQGDTDGLSRAMGDCNKGCIGH